MAAQGIAEHLTALLGADLVKSDLTSLEAYSRDATPLFRGVPEVIVSPRTTADVVKVVKFANETNTPIIARGAGSNLSGATVPLQGGIVLAMANMKAVLEVSKSEMIAVVQPGVTNIDLDDLVAKEGLRFIPDPGSRNVSTIGGNAATSAGGLRGLKYGTTKNYVLGLEAVIGTGEILRTGGRLVKDVAGYDITRLLVGSEGTLGIFTEITVALAPRPQLSKYGVAYFDSLASAAHAVDQVMLAGLLPATLEFLDNTCIVAVEDAASHSPQMLQKQMHFSMHVAAHCLPLPALAHSPSWKILQYLAPRWQRQYARSKRSHSATTYASAHSVMPAMAISTPPSWLIKISPKRYAKQNSPFVKFSKSQSISAAPSPANMA